MKSWLLIWVSLFFIAIGKVCAVPVHTQFGKPEWQSSTHLRIPLIITIDQGWKIYGSPHENDTLQRPTVLSWSGSTNIAHIEPNWPETTLWKEGDQQAHVYYDQVSVPLDIFLHDRTSGQLELAIEGLSCSKVCQPFALKTSLSLTPPQESSLHWLKMLLFA